MSKEPVSADELHAKWLKDPKYRKIYGFLEEEYRLASARIEARSRTSRSPRPRAVGS